MTVVHDRDSILFFRSLLLFVAYPSLYISAIMGGKKKSEESRRFEKERRDKLNIAFDELSKLLPEHDPSVTLSKIEILRRAAAYIKQLQEQNEKIIKMGSDSALKEESEKLKKRVAQLIIKTNELVNVLRNAGVTIPVNKKSKKEKPVNQNQILPPLQSSDQSKEENEVKCCCIKEKRPLKEVNTTSTQITEQASVLTDSTNIISITPLNTLSFPIPESTPVHKVGELPGLSPLVSVSTEMVVIPNTSTVNPSVVHPCIFQNAKITAINSVSQNKLDPSPLTTSGNDCGIQMNGVSPSNANGATCNVVTSTSSQAITTKTVVNSTTLGIQTDSIASNQGVSSNISNVPVLEKRIIPDFGASTLILADSRIVVPQIVPQILVKPSQTVILLSATTKREKFLLPKKRDVTKTTFTNKAPIPAIPPFRVEPSLKLHQKKKVKADIKIPEKGKQNDDLPKRRKLEDIRTSDLAKESPVKRAGHITGENKQLEQESSSVHSDNLISSPTSVGSAISENPIINTLNSKQVTPNTVSQNAEIEPVINEQPSSSINIELLNEAAESSLSNIQLHEIGISGEVEKNCSNSNSPHFIISDKNNQICSDINVQMSTTCTSELIQRELNKEISGPEIPLSENNTNDKFEPSKEDLISPVPALVNNNNNTVNNDSITNNNISILNCPKNDSSISNIPPCISSIAIHDSLFKTPSQGLSLNENSTLSFSSDILSHTASFSSDVPGKIIDENICQHSEKVPNQVLNNDQVMASASPLDKSHHVMDANNKVPELTKSVTADSGAINSSEVITNPEIISPNPPISKGDLEKRNNLEVSSSVSEDAPSSTIRVGKKLTNSHGVTNANIMGDGSERSNQSANCLTEPPPPKVFLADSFSQPNSSDLQEQCKVAAVSVPNSQLSSHKTPISARDTNKCSVNRSDFKISNYSYTEKSTNSDLLSFINPINTSSGVTSSIYSSHPSTSYYTNESQTYIPAAFSQKHNDALTQSLPEKHDLFSNIMPADGEKNLYSQNIPVSQSSHLVTSELVKPSYSKNHSNIGDAWDNHSPKEKSTFHNNSSKSSEKDNECSEKGYLNFHNDAISISNNNLFPSFASSLPVTCGFMDTSSVFSYQSTCPSVISGPFNKATTSEMQTQPEQNYISNILSSTSIPSSLIGTDRLNAGCYSTSSHNNDINISLPSCISMYSSYVTNNVYGNSSLQSTPRGYSFSSNSSTLQSNTFNSSQTSSLFNHSNSTQTNITSLFSNPPDMSGPNKTTTASGTFAIPTKTTCSVVFSTSSNNENVGSVQTGSNLNSPQTKTSVYPNYNHLRIPSQSTSMAGSSTKQTNSSAAYSSSTLTNNTSQANASDLFLPGSLQPEISNIFNSFQLSSTTTTSSQPKTNISTVYSLSKSSISCQASVSGICGSSIASDNSNLLSSISLPSIPNMHINLSQSLITTCVSSADSNKSPIFTQASSSGINVSSMQLEGANSTVSSLEKPRAQSNISNFPKNNDLMWNTSSLPSISMNFTQMNSSQNFTQSRMAGTFTSSQPGVTNILTSMALPNVPNTQSKLTPVPNAPNSVQNNIPPKPNHTDHNEVYFSSYQAGSDNMLSDLSPHNCNQSASLPEGSTVQTSSSSMNSLNNMVQTKDSRSYPRPEVRPTSMFTNAPLPVKSGVQPPFISGNMLTDSSSVASEGFSDPNKYQGQPGPSLYDKQNNSSLPNASKNNCLPESTLNSEMSDKNVNDKHQSLDNSKEPAFISNFNSSTCDSQGLSKKKGFGNNHQALNIIDSNNLNGKQRNLSGIECAYLNDKNPITNNFTSPASKENPIDTGKRPSYSNILHESTSVQDVTKSSNTQSMIENTKKSDINTYELPNKGSNTQNGSEKSETETSDNSKKTFQSNAKSYDTPVNNVANSNSECSEQILINHKSASSYNCNHRNSSVYTKSFQPQNVVPSSSADSSFQGNCYSSYNSSSYNQYNNGTLPLTNRDTNMDDGGPGQSYGNAINKETSPNATSETILDKQNKSVQKPYSLGNTLKGDAHLDLLKTKDIEKNTFIPIGYEDMRLPSDFSSDLFSSLQVPTGGQHSESISPTAAFLLAFPLVSTSKNVESLNETENHETHTPTPTTILQIGNIDPPSTELFHPIDFQKNNTKTTDQFDLNSDYLQLPELSDKQNSSYKRCDKRKDSFIDFGKDIRTKQKSKISVSTTSTYSQSYSNSLMPCSDYQFCDKEGSQWQQEFGPNIPKEQKKVCDRKRDKINQKVCYHQNYQDCYNYKDKKRKQQNRISVNWMSTPENREQTDYQQKEVDGVMAPPSQTIYSGISLDFASETFSDMSTPKKVNNYSWSPSKTLLPSLDNHLMIPSTLPTLVGDLALGTSTPSESYKTFETPKLLPQGAMTKKTPDKLEESKKRNDFPKTQTNFFSVSQLVDPKSKKQKTIERNYRRPDKNIKGRNTFNCPKRKDDQCMFYEDKNNFVSNPNQFSEKRNHYKGGSYSAESLIGAQSHELDFSPSFNYQQNTNYFQNDFPLNPDGSTQQYSYLQQNNVGGFNQEDCQEFGFGTSQRNMDNIRQKSTRKENSYIREGSGVLPHLSSYPPYTKSINYNLPPPSNQVHSLNTNTTNTLTNFNLSTIFPEMNDQRAATSVQPSQSINHSFSNPQNYRGHLT